MRLLTEKTVITSPDHSKSYTFIVQTAESLEGIYSFLSSLRKNIITGITLSILVFISIGSLILYISLRPLTEFSEEIAMITDRNLGKRLRTEDVTKELRILARSFNQMMDSLEKAFNIERRFISDASHELRTPVSVIKGCCEIYTRRQRDEKEYKEALDIIYWNVRKMESIVERLLLLSRLDEKRLPMKMMEISLNEVVNTGVKLLQPSFDLNNIYLIVTLRDECYVVADKDFLTEAILNIIDNAIKYSPKGSNIEIRLNKIGHEACVEIEDHGIGIPEEEAEKIFYRFYRVKNSDTKQKGMGLGLSIAKEIIEAFHGRIEVKSSVGKGSTFSVYLPLSRTEAINR